ncbi:MAG: Acetyl-coenzyme A synthetase [Brockia lithotrophica]|uniref:acetate--CoA ligase n=1 Tax=Brockia lithotrophica TaxID=933949 RepID=A0A2T5G663_9BACL|nr:MAG: Acetyl-coenzyme A synthetase [Brockia lithotrophica]
MFREALFLEGSKHGGAEMTTEDRPLEAYREARLLHVGKPLIPPSQELQRKCEAALGLTRAEVQALMEQAAENPVAYWEHIAHELHWFSGWTTAFEGTFTDFRFFSGGLTNVSVNCIDRHLPAARNKVALFYEREDGLREIWTYQDLYEATARLARALADSGVRPGDHIALFSSNIPEAFVSMHAAYRLGAVYTVLFAGFSVEAVRERLRDFSPKVVLVADATIRRGKLIPLKPTLDAAIEGLGVERVVVFRRFGIELPMDPHRDIAYEDFVSGIPAEFDPVPVEANAPGFVIYTSGTTSKPKGLVHSGVGFLLGTYANVKWSLAPRPDDRVWVTADVGWLTAPIFGVVGGLAHGLTLVLYEGAPDSPNPGRFYDVLERYRVNKLFTAPTLLRMLRRDGEKWIHGNELLEVIALVGEPLDPETFTWAYEVLGRRRAFVNNTYGQSETGTAWASSIVGITATKPGATGHALPGYLADVLDDEGKPVPPGEVGYLVLKNPFPSLARTLYREPERYRNLYFGRFPGYYYTGDAAVRDADGMFWVVGRVDDVINVAGHRIGTMELEAALTEHPAVAEAAVIGVPDAIKGEMPFGFVVLRQGYTASEGLERELIERVARSVGSYAKPKRVVIVPTLPRTRSGKIMRRLLKELLLAGEIRGDLTSLDNPDSIERLAPLRDAWSQSL